MTTKTEPTPYTPFLQACFARMVQGIVAQGGGSRFVRDASDPDGFTCAYLDEEGRKCHIGLFIPEASYCGELEGRSVSEDWEDLTSYLGDLPPTPAGLDLETDATIREFFREAQHAHDTCFRLGERRLWDWAEYHHRMATLAAVYRLDPAILTTVPLSS